MTTLDAPAGRRVEPAVGRSVARPDVPPKLDGSFAFSNDLVVPGMLFGATVRSPHPAAVVDGVDLGPALARPGVVDAFTIDDVPGARWVGHIVVDQPVLADGEVRYQGEPVAFVVATSQEEAWRAADSVVVRYGVLPPLTDPATALDPDARELHPAGNLFRRLVLRRGEARPAAVEVTGCWETGRQDQAFLGPESALALPDADGGVTLHLATQDLHTDRDQVAAALGLPVAAVRVELAGVGGAFGGREDITCQVHLALAARRTGRPVKTTYRRDESFLAHPQRHPARLEHTVGADADGHLLYVRARIRLDGGAYASTSGPVLGSACYFAVGPYRVPAVDVVGEAVRTNNPVAGAMRGFGSVQACFGIESTLDLLAERLRMDPVELRRRNALRQGDPFPTTGQPFDSGVDLVGLIDRCVELPMPADGPDPSDPSDPYARPGGTGRTSLGEGLRRGVGFAVGIKSNLYGEGVPEWSEAVVSVSAAGVEVRTAATEVGQGLVSAVHQVASDAMGGLPVMVAAAHTDAGYAGSSSASRQTWMAAGAVLEACAAVTDRLREVVARRLGTTADAVALADGAVVVDGRPLELAEALGDEEVGAEGRYDAPATRPFDPATGRGDVHVGWMLVAQRAVVEVDTDLGLAKVVQVAIAQDVGVALNPREVRGQMTGGIAQGVGLALTEHLSAPNGVVVNGSFADYLIPTAGDVPDYEVAIVESAGSRGPLGLRGAGEPSSLSSTAAVAAALRAATGRPVSRVPARPQDLVG